MDLLEKRVKSRFSHRQIFLFPPATFGDFVEMARDALTLPDDITEEAYITKFNQTVKVNTYIYILHTYIYTYYIYIY